MGPPKKFVCFPKFFFWEVGLGYVSYHQTFGYHTPNSYLCTKSPNFDIFDFCQIFVFFNHFLQGNEHFNFKYLIIRECFFIGIESIITMKNSKNEKKNLFSIIIKAIFKFSKHYKLIYANVSTTF